MSTAHRTAASEALDAATPGKKGKARAGFHLYLRPVRFTTPTGINGLRHEAERCTCPAKGGNHATPPIAR